MTVEKKDCADPASVSTDGLAGTAFFDADMLKKAVMSDLQEKLAEMGICPNCHGKLQNLSDCSSVVFNGCDKCGHVWVLPANVN